MTETNGSPDQPPPGYPAQQYPGAQPYPGPQQYPQPQYGNTNYGQQYNAYGGGPYGYPQGYYAAPPPGTNGMAIASLVLGICGFMCVTPFAGLGLGIAALSRIGKTGQAGRGMAIAGIVLSSAWICLLVLGLAVGSFHLNIGPSDPGPSVVQTQGPDGTSA